MPRRKAEYVRYGTRQGSQPKGSPITRHGSDGVKEQVAKNSFAVDLFVSTSGKELLRRQLCEILVEQLLQVVIAMDCRTMAEM